MSVKEILDELEQGKRNWEQVPEALQNAILEGRTLGDDEIALLEKGEKPTEPGAPAPVSDKPTEPPAPAPEPPKDDKPVEPVAPAVDPAMAELEKNPAMKALYEAVLAQRAELQAQISLLTQAVADPNKMAQAKAVNELDQVMETHGLDFDGESFTQADSKWTAVYNHFKGDNAALEQYIANKEEQAKLGLPLPANFDKYQTVAQVYRHYMDIKAKNPKASFADMLRIYGVEAKPKSTPAPATPPRPSQGTNHQQTDGLLPPGNGSPNLVGTDDIAVLFTKLEKYGDDSLSPEEKAKISAALDADATAAR